MHYQKNSTKSDHAITQLTKNTTKNSYILEIIKNEGKQAISTLVTDKSSTKSTEKRKMRHLEHIKD